MSKWWGKGGKISNVFSGVKTNIAGGPSVPSNLDPANQGVGDYTKYGFNSGNVSTTGNVPSLMYSKKGSTLEGLNSSTYLAALKAAGDGETGQLKKLARLLKV